MTHRTYQIAAALIIVTAAYGCKLEAQLPRQERSAQQSGRTREPSGKSATAASTASAAIVSPDSLFDVLLPMFGEVYSSPAGQTPRATLLTTAFDSTSGCFRTIGKGVENADTRIARRAGRKRAAESDAKRWALYLRAWQLGDTRDFGAPIEGQVSYFENLYSRIVNDTLYILVSIPIGNVEVKTVTRLRAPRQEQHCR